MADPLSALCSHRDRFVLAHRPARAMVTSRASPSSPSPGLRQGWSDRFFMGPTRDFAGVSFAPRAAHAGSTALTLRSSFSDLHRMPPRVLGTSLCSFLLDIGQHSTTIPPDLAAFGSRHPGPKSPPSSYLLRLLPCRTHPRLGTKPTIRPFS